jgi:hypothetical protein
MQKPFVVVVNVAAAVVVAAIAVENDTTRHDTTIRHVINLLSIIGPLPSTRRIVADFGDVYKSFLIERTLQREARRRGIRISRWEIMPSSGGIHCAHHRRRGHNGNHYGIGFCHGSWFHDILLGSDGSFILD